MNAISGAINSVWGVTQEVLVIACLGAVVFGALVFLALPFIALFRDDKRR